MDTITLGFGQGFKQKHPSYIELCCINPSTSVWMYDIAVIHPDDHDQRPGAEKVNAAIYLGTYLHTKTLEGAQSSTD